MKMKSIAALAVSGFLTLAISAPLFAEGDNAADNTQATGQAAPGMTDSSQKSDGAAPSTDATATDSNKASGDEGNQQDTATGDDDY